DEHGNIMAETETLNDPTQPGANQGMGRFEFTPQAGKPYELKIDTPAGMEGRYLLPGAKPDGVMLTVPTGVSAANEPIRVAVRSGQPSQRLLVGAYCRGRLMAHERVVAAAGQAAEVVLRPEAGAGGVYRVTVFEEQGLPGGPVQLTPRAERLIYRVPAHRLNL